MNHNRYTVSENQAISNPKDLQSSILVMIFSWATFKENYVNSVKNLRGYAPP